MLGWIMVLHAEFIRYYRLHVDDWYKLIKHLFDVSCRSGKIK